MSLPSGYSTELGERGSNLSGGQRQRLAIARTLLANPKLLVMDEATSALDYDTEKRVCQNLRESLNDCTVFFVTHRLSTVRKADMIIMMHQGAIVETGTHDEMAYKVGTTHCSASKRQIDMKIPFQRIKDSANTLTSLRDKEISSSNSKLKPFYSVIKSLTELCEDQGEVIEQSPFWSRATIVGLMSSALFALGWLSIAKTDEIVTVTGKLEPLGSVQDIQMPLGGIASEILVKDGEEVRSGQIVMKLDAETTQQRLISLQESHKLKALQLDLKETELEKYLLLNMAEINMLKRNLDLQEEILSRFESLTREGASSELQYLQQLNNVAEIKGKLDQVKIDRLRQEAAQKQQIQQLKADIKDLDSRITEASVNLRYQALKAPVDGIVFDLQPRGKGYVAQSTETVMKIVPYDKLHARVEIPSNQIGFVKIGMDTDLSIDSFPASDLSLGRNCRKYDQMLLP